MHIWCRCAHRSSRSFKRISCLCLQPLTSISSVQLLIPLSRIKRHIYKLMDIGTQLLTRTPVSWRRPLPILFLINIEFRVKALIMYVSPHSMFCILSLYSCVRVIVFYSLQFLHHCTLYMIHLYYWNYFTFIAFSLLISHCIIHE